MLSMAHFVAPFALLYAAVSCVRAIRHRMRSLRSLHRVTMLFDGECAMCNAFVDFCIARDPSRRLKVASLGSEVGRRLMAAHGVPQPPSSFVVIEEFCHEFSSRQRGGGAAQRGAYAYQKSDAALRSLSALSPSAWVLMMAFEPVPRALRDPIYALGWRWRRRLFGTTVCRRRPGREAG